MKSIFSPFRTLFHLCAPSVCLCSGSIARARLRRTVQTMHLGFCVFPVMRASFRPLLSATDRSRRVFSQSTNFCIRVFLALVCSDGKHSALLSRPCVACDQLKFLSFSRSLPTTRHLSLSRPIERLSSNRWTFRAAISQIDWRCWKQRDKCCHTFDEMWSSFFECFFSSSSFSSSSSRTKR